MQCCPPSRPSCWRLQLNIVAVRARVACYKCLYNNNNNNNNNNNRPKCIADDTKAVARRSPNCIKKTKENKQNTAKNDFRYGGWNSFTLQCDMWLWDHDIDSPGGSTLQWDMRLSNDMSLNSPKRPPYWNSTSGFNFDHITAVDVILHQSAKFYPKSAEKWRHVDFPDGGSQPSWILGVQ